MPHQEIKGCVSVTQVTDILSKPFLYRWYAKFGWEECERKKKEAQRCGTFVHDSITKFLKGESLPLSVIVRDRQMVDQFIKWSTSVQLEPFIVEPEQPLKNEKLGLQGTPDFIGKFNDRIAVLDWKTSSSMSDTMGLQLAAYANLYAHSYGVPVPNLGVIIRLDEDRNSPEIRRFEDLKSYWKAFRGLLTAYDLLYRKESK